MKIISEIKSCFNVLENKLLLILSLYLGLISLFFVSDEVDFLAVFNIFSEKIIILLYFLGLLSFISIWLYVIFKKKFSWVDFFEKNLWVFSFLIFFWLLGFAHSIHYQYSFKIIAGLYFITLGLFIIFKIKKYNKISNFWKSNIPLKENLKKDLSKGTVLAVMAIVLVTNLSFGLYHLSKFAAVDEALWTQQRIPRFWNNVTEREWEKTMISDKPGITVVLISGLGKLKVDPKDYEDVIKKGALSDMSLNVKVMNFAMRLPILLFNWLALFLFYVFLKYLLGCKRALLSVVFIGLSPLLLGMSTIINPDSLLWVFSSLSLIAFLNYLKKKEDYWLYLAGVMLGFSILTKYVANILYVFFFGLIFLEYIFHRKKYFKVSIGKYFKKIFGDYFILIFISLIIFYIFLPESWVKIDTLLEGTIFSQAFQKVWPIFLLIILGISLEIWLLKGKITAGVLNFFAKQKRIICWGLAGIFILLAAIVFFNTYLDMRWFDLESILASPKTSFLKSGVLGMMLANLYSLIFGVSPWVLIGSFFVLLALFFKKKEKLKNSFVVVTLVSFILLYYLASSVNQVSATVRYQIMLYPLFFILAALGWLEFINSLKIKNKLVFGGFLILFLLTGIYSLNFIRPFYFSYASDLLPEKYVLNLKDMGDGSYEAAQHLNSLPNSERMNIWTDKRGVCMFYIGECHSSVDIEKGEFSFDYFVVSAGRESRTSKMVISRIENGSTIHIRLDKLYNSKNYEWKLEIGDRPNNFVKIIKGDQIKQ